MSDDAIPDRSEWPAWVQKAIKSAIDERVAAKNEKIGLLESELSKAREQAETAGGASSELERVRAEYADFRRGIEEASAFRAAGIDPDDENNAALLERIRVLYRHDTHGSDEPKGIADWLSADAPNDPLLAPYLPKQADPETAEADPAPEGNPAPAPAAPPAGLPARHAGAAPPPMPKRRTVQDVRAERKAIMAEANRYPANHEKRRELLDQARAKLEEARALTSR